MKTFVRFCMAASLFGLGASGLFGFVALILVMLLGLGAITSDSDSLAEIQHNARTAMILSTIYIMTWAAGYGWGEQIAKNEETESEKEAESEDDS